MFFSAADIDLDGRIGIWTDDAASVEELRELALERSGLCPPIVLRFVRDRLLDIVPSSIYFAKITDGGPSSIRKTLPISKAAMAGWRFPLIPADRLSHLRSIKMRVLEIVGPTFIAAATGGWRSLAEMWPPADLDRIRAALLNARAHGILSQVDGVSTPVPAGHESHAKVFDATITVVATPGVTPKGVTPKPPITTPRAILMERLPPSDVYEAELMRSESLLKLVIDSAGKVRSVEVMGNTQETDEGLIKSTANWKFIPAFSDGEHVYAMFERNFSLSFTSKAITLPEASATE